jgi:hypothetical protein
MLDLGVFVGLSPGEIVLWVLVGMGLREVLEVLGVPLLGRWLRVRHVRRR